MTASAAQSDRLHASCVALGHRALLITGPSGSGKSSLALQLMALGCYLVADDQTLLSARGGLLWAEAPAAIRGRIEARGVGILAAETALAAHVTLVVDMGQTETERLPQERTVDLCGVTLPCLGRIAAPHFAAGLLLYLKAGRIA